MGSRDGDGAVDGRLRMGRRGFVGVLLPSALPDLGPTPRREDASFSKPPLLGVEGVLMARPADRGRSGVISCMFPFPCIVDGRFLLATDPDVGSGSLRVVAVDGRGSRFGLFLLRWVVTLVVVDGRLPVVVVWGSPDVVGRIIPFPCEDEDEEVLTTPALVVALCFFSSLV